MNSKEKQQGNRVRGGISREESRKNDEEEYQRALTMSPKEIATLPTHILLKLARMDRQLIRKNMADELDVTPGAISSLELGHRRPSQDMIEGYGIVTGYHPLRLIGPDGEVKPGVRGLRAFRKSSKRPKL